MAGSAPVRKTFSPYLVVLRTEKVTAMLQAAAALLSEREESWLSEALLGRSVAVVRTLMFDVIKRNGKTQVKS